MTLSVLDTFDDLTNSMADDTEDVNSSIRVPLLLYAVYVDHFYSILSRFLFWLAFEASTGHPKIGVADVEMYKLTISVFEERNTRIMLQTGDMFKI